MALRGTAGLAAVILLGGVVCYRRLCPTSLTTRAHSEAAALSLEGGGGIGGPGTGYHRQG